MGVLRNRKEKQEGDQDRGDFKAPLSEGQLTGVNEDQMCVGQGQLWTRCWTLFSQSGNRALIFLERVLATWCSMVDDQDSLQHVPCL